MGLNVTKQGNFYKETNAGKLVGLAAGGAAGYKYLSPQITNYVKNSLKELAKDTFQNGGVKVAAQSAKYLNKIAKYAGPIGAAAIGLAGYAIGGFLDSCVNHGRQIDADKKAKARKNQI